MTLETDMNTYHQKQSATPECAICEDTSHGVHFGVNVCRACAAFFRRSTISNRSYHCRFGGDCQIGKDIRCSCRACRMNKCMKMGMDPSGVQRHRDQIGPRKRGDLTKRKSAKQPRKPFNTTVNKLKSEIEISSSILKDMQQPASPTLNAINQPLDNSERPFSSPICSPFNNLQLLGVSLRRNIEEISSNYNEAKSYTVLTTAASQPSVEDQTSKNMASALIMENVLLSAIRNANDNSRGNMSGFYSTSSFNSPSSSSPSLSSSCLNPKTNLLASDSHTIEWDNRPSTSSAFCKPVDEQQTVFKTSLKCLETVENQQQPNLFSNTPFINEMLKGFKKFTCLRKTASDLNNGVSLHRLFDDNEELIEGTYADNVTSLKNDLSLISDMINDHFQPLSSFSIDSKWALLRTFFCPFVMTERTYNSTKNFPDKEDTRFMISSRHFTDLNNLRSFFDVESCKVDPNRMASIFNPTFNKLSSLLGKPMRNLNMSEEELVGLLGLNLWNDKAEGLSEEELKVIEKTREFIHNELYHVCCKQANGDLTAGVIRFGTICNFVHLTDKCAHELASNFSLANVTNSFEIDTFLHSLNPQAW